MLFVTHRFFPDCDAATRCVASIMSSMNSKQIVTDVVHLVTVSQPPAPGQPVLLGQTFPCFCPGCADRDDLHLILRQGAFPIARFIFAKLLHKLGQKLSARSRRCGLNRTMYRAFRRCIRERLRCGGYDAVIATLCPAEGALAAAELAGEVPFFLYQLDPYTENGDMPVSQRDARRRLEEQLYRKARAVFTTPILCESKRDHRFPGWEKCRSLEFPLVTPGKVSLAPRQAPRFLGVFAGTLYPTIRPADDLVQLAALLSDKPIDFCCLGSGMQYLLCSPFLEQGQTNIRCLGKLPPQRAEELIEEADFLVNIDNKAANQVPSKIFEYISTGKPIVNLYYDPASPTLAYFSRYPSVLNLLCDPAHAGENAAAVWAFVQDCRHKRVSARCIEEAFREATPDVVAQRMLASIRGGSAS